MLFPDGFNYSEIEIIEPVKLTVYLPTSSFKEDYNSKKKKETKNSLRKKS
jgi:hypothetical protein